MIKDKNRIIFSDVDGTIYSHNQKWSDSTEESIKNVMAKGIEFVVCTGNPYFDRMKLLHSKINNQYFIGSSGAIVYDIWNDKVIWQSSIDQEVAQQLFDLSNEYELDLHWWDQKGIWGNQHMTEHSIDILHRYVSKEIPAKRVSELGTDIHKMEFNFKRTPEKIEKLERILEKIDKSKLALARVSLGHLEITSKDATKGFAALQLVKYLNMQDAEIMTIGDSANDHSMFEITNHSFAMGNAPKETKDLARNITKDVMEDGLGYAIDIFLEITK